MRKSDILMVHDDIESLSDEDYYPDEYFSNEETEDEKDTDEEFIHSEQGRFYDHQNPKIYVLKPGCKKGRRIQNQKHSCLNCRKKVLHLGQHLKQHPNDPEVRSILDARGKDREIKQEMYRNRGDNRNNIAVENAGEGELLLSRRPSSDFNIADYGPCDKCFLWVLKENLLKHSKSCVARTSTEDEHRTVGDLSASSDILAGRVAAPIGKELKTKLFARMKDDGDGVKRMILSDPLCVRFAKFWWTRTKCHDLNKQRVVSEKTRLCAKLLMTAQKICEEEDPESYPKSWWAALRPRYFNTFIEAALKLTAPSGQGSYDSMDNPSAAIKVKYVIQRLCKEKQLICSQKGDATEDKLLKQQYMDHNSAAEQLGRMVHDEWRFRVTSMAEAQLQEKQLGKLERLPLPEDLRILNTYTSNQCKTLDLKKTLSEGQFNKNCKYVMTRLYVFNRRRPIEIAAMRVDCYHKRSTKSNIDEALIGQLTGSEKKHFSSYDLVQTIGKGNQIVPVLIPPECQAGLAWVADPHIRKQAGISSCKYLFASGSPHNPVLSPNKHLEECGKEAGIQHPEWVGGISMRHFCATLTQSMCLNQFQFDHVLKHFGHTRKTHLTNYRIDAPALERLEVGKILLMQDRNVQHLFRSRPLDEVSFEEILNADNGELHSDSRVGSARIDNVDLPDPVLENSLDTSDESEEEIIESPAENKKKRKILAQEERDSEEIPKKKTRKLLQDAGTKTRSNDKLQSEDESVDEVTDTTEDKSGGKTSRVKKRKLSSQKESGHKVSEETHKPVKKNTSKQRKRAHNSWGTVEDELKEIFAECLTTLITPTRRKVASRLILCNASQELKERGASLIVKKLSAEIQKIKKRNL